MIQPSLFDAPVAPACIPNPSVVGSRAIAERSSIG